MMNDMMPFSSNTNVPPSMNPPQVWPSYNNPQQQQPYAPRRAAPAVKPVAKSNVAIPGAAPVSLKATSEKKVNSK